MGQLWYRGKVGVAHFQVTDQTLLAQAIGVLLSFTTFLSYWLLCNSILFLCFFNDGRRTQLLKKLKIPNISTFTITLVPDSVLRSHMSCLLLTDWVTLAEHNEGHVHALLSLIVDKSSIVVDAGASEGKYVRQLSRIAERVIAIEPNCRSFAILTKNARDWNNVVLVNMAVFNRNGYTKLFLGRFDGLSSVVIKRSSEWQRIHTVTLDSLLGNLGVTHVDVLKIDTEGAELAVLQGAIQTLRANQKIKLIIEYHWGGFTRCLHIIAFLRSEGFCHEWLDPIHLYAYRNQIESRSKVMSPPTTDT